MDNMIIERAKTAAIARDFALAARLYKGELKKDPNNMEILRALADIYVKSGEDEKAIPYYENLLTFNSHDVMSMNSLGAIYRRLKQYEKSIDILTKALDEDEKTAVINYTLGFTYKDMGNLEDAIDCFENVITENPNDVLAYNHLGVIYTSLKEYIKAEATFRRGLQIDPNHPIIQYNLAHTYEGLKDYTSAGRCYELALKSKPGWTDAVKDYASLLISCKKTIQASANVKKACAIYPRDAELQSLLGRIYLKQFDWENAEKAFTKAHNVKPNDLIILSGLAEACEKNGNAVKAAEYLKEAAEKPDAQTDLKKQYAHILLTAKNLGLAYQIIQEMHEANPNDVEVLDLRAQYAICLGDTGRVAECFDEIGKKFPDYAHHYLDGARRYFQNESYEEAFKLVYEYSNRRNNNAAAYNLKGDIYVAQKNYRMAICTFWEAVATAEENVAAKKALRYLEDIEPEVSQTVEKPVVEEEEESDLLELIEDEEFDFGAMTGKTIEDEEDANLDELKKSEDASFEEVAESVNALADHEVPIENSDFTVDDLEDIDIDELEDEPEEEEEEPPLKVENAPLTFEPDSPATIQSPQIADSVKEAAERAEEIAKSVAEAQEKMLDALEKLQEQKKADKTDEADDFSEQLNKHSPIEQSFTAPEAEPDVKESMESAGNGSRRGLGDEVTFSDPFGDGNDFNATPESILASPVDRSVKGSNMFQEPEFSEPEMSDPFQAFEDYNPGMPEFSDPKFDEFDDIQKNLEAARAFKDAKNFIPKIIKMLEDKDKAERFHSEIDLFTKLRSLSDFLSPEEKKVFMSSRTRLLMDYLVAKMSGSPGLLKTMQGLVKSGALGNDVDPAVMEKAVAGLTGDELTKKVLNDMKEMTESLADRDLAKALRDAADEALAKL
ncbi:MAG: tetratricopeptide repeat protein [Treponema sp.]|nr:tetratricopeptide repeat protein [Treponema sp.]